jgi:hypothetical protein
MKKMKRVFMGENRKCNEDYKLVENHIKSVINSLIFDIKNAN